MSNIERYHIIDNEDSLIHIALDIMSQRRIEEDLRDAWSFHKRVSNTFWGAENKTERLRISLELRSNILHGSDDVVFFLNLLYKFSLSRFNLSIHDSFDLLILIVNNLSLCTIDERELISNTLKQFISAIAKLLNFFLLANTYTLRLD